MIEEGHTTQDSLCARIAFRTSATIGLSSLFGVPHDPPSGAVEHQTVCFTARGAVGRRFSGRAVSPMIEHLTVIIRPRSGK